MENSKRIVCIEDEPEMIDLMRLILTCFVSHCCVAASGIARFRHARNPSQHATVTLNRPKRYGWMSKNRQILVAHM